MADIGKIQSREIVDEMRESYLDYAMSVIVARALPDARDGLKPVHRRILYSMHEMGLGHTAKFRKSAAVVGDVLGKYHPHGDIAVYDSLVRMAQDFSLRYRLIDGQGNFGCFTGDTKIQLVDGRALTFTELLEETKRGKKHYTYTLNSETKKIEIAEIRAPRKTKSNSKLVKVVLDSGAEIRCTPDHRFMLRDGSYREARHLTAGNSLMPLYTRLSAKEDDGYIELSLKEAGEERRWVDLKRMAQEGEALDLPVLEANRGGLILEAFGIKGFLPSSQLSSQHYPRVDGGDKEKIYRELQKLVGQPLKVKILDVSPLDNKLIFTEKGQQSENLRAAVAKYKIGDTIEGEITGVVDFGAFMKFDEQGLEGLIHISEIDWLLVEDPRSILKPGDKVSAKVIDIQGDKVSLSLKQLKEDPWLRVPEKYKKGDTVRGKVTKFNPFGAFVEFDLQVQGLLHISEFGTEAKMREELELGKEYDFKVLMVDAKEHKMSLGMIRDGTKEEKAADKE